MSKIQMKIFWLNSLNHKLENIIWRWKFVIYSSKTINYFQGKFDDISMICWFYIEFLKKSVYCTSTFQRTSNEVIRWWAAAVAQFISTRRPKQTIKCRIFFSFFFQVENQSSYSTRWQWISYRRLVTKNRCQVTSCLINLDTRGSLIGHRTQRPSRRFVLLIYSVVSSDISPLLDFDMKIWTFFFALQTWRQFSRFTDRFEF